MKNSLGHNSFFPRGESGTFRRLHTRMEPAVICGLWEVTDLTVTRVAYKLLTTFWAPNCLLLTSLGKCGARGTWVRTRACEWPLAGSVGGFLFLSARFIGTELSSKQTSSQGISFSKGR